MGPASLRRGDASASFTYPARPVSVRQSRRDVARFLERCGADEDALDVVTLATSELMTNALAHHPLTEAERIALRARIAPGPRGMWVSVLVADAGHGKIRRLAADGDPVGEHGRGLMMLRSLGVQVTDAVHRHSYQVTAALPLAAELRALVCRCGCLEQRHGISGLGSRSGIGTDADLGTCEIFAPGTADVEAFPQAIAPLCLECRKALGLHGVGSEPALLYATSPTLRAGASR